MNKFGVILVPMILLIWGISLLKFIDYNSNLYEQIQEKKLKYAANYASDAAVDILVESSADLGMDYSDYESIVVNPAVALDTFLGLFCRNYGMLPNKENFALIKNDYLTAFIVTAYDGYYIGKSEEINSSGAIDLIFSVKQPYIYESEDGVIYALNLGKVDVKQFDESLIKKVDAPISKEKQKVVINDIISDVLTSTVFKVKGGNVQSAVYLPAELTNLTTTNPIEGVAVIAYVGNPDLAYKVNSEALGIGGARVSHTVYCACYKKDGVLMYCYSDKLPGGVTVIATYESAELAAQHGYYFDITTL